MVFSARLGLPPTLVVFGIVLFGGCSLPGRDDAPAPVAPPMIGAAEPGEAKPVRRRKIRFAQEIANSPVKKQAARRRKEAEATRVDPFVMANSSQKLTSPDGKPYPHTTPNELTTSSPASFSLTQRLPDVRQVAYSRAAPY